MWCFSFNGNNSLTVVNKTQLKQNTVSYWIILAQCMSRQLVHCQRLEYEMKLVSSVPFQVAFPLVPHTGITRYSPHTGVLQVTGPCPTVVFYEITSPSLVVAKSAGSGWEMRSQPGRTRLSLADKALGFGVCISFVRRPSKEQLMSNIPASVAH